MLGLQRLVKKCTLKVLYGGNCPILSKLSANYMNEFKIGNYPFAYMGKMTEDIGMKVADVFEAAEHEPDNKFVQAAYAQLAKEVVNQFEYVLENEKIKFTPFEGTGEPYSSSYEMLEDIHNYHMYFFKTELGFGEEEYNDKNTMLNKTGIKIGDYELLVNDIFRIVHDIFGHATNGYGFGPIGEDKAWFSHMKMFTPLAAAALSMETRGQNCWVNFGKHLRNKNNELFKEGDLEYLSPAERPFAAQKMNLLPSYITGIEVFEENNKVDARYVNFWDPLESILIN